jgi:hypothetical protein
MPKRKARAARATRAFTIEEELNLPVLLFPYSPILPFFLIWNQVAREEFEDAFGGADDGGGVEADVEAAAQQALLLDFIASEANGEDCADKGDGLD